jgi:hypothetical protein
MIEALLAAELERTAACGSGSAARSALAAKVATATPGLTFAEVKEELGPPMVAEEFWEPGPPRQLDWLFAGNDGNRTALQVYLCDFDGDDRLTGCAPAPWGGGMSEFQTVPETSHGFAGFGWRSAVRQTRGAVTRVSIKSAARRTALVVGLFVGAGYLSNLVSRPWCERDLMRAAVLDMGSGKPMPLPVFVFPETEARSERALRDLGVSTVRCSHRADGPVLFACFPWAGVESRIAIPYIVVVRWEYVAFPTSGHGRVTTFVCLFGLRVRVSERGLWVS